MWCTKTCRHTHEAARVYRNTCEGCGKKFRTKREDARYCNMQCRFPGKRSVAYICEQCDEPFQAFVSSEENGKRRFCSKPCFYAYQTENSQGSINEDGYVVISVDGVRKIEHRYVMSQILGRKLRKGENVHHKNGIKHDNDPSNLELWTTSQPPGARVEDKVEWAIEFLKLYRPEVLKEPEVKKKKLLRRVA